MCQPGAVDYPFISIYFYIQFNLHLQLLEATTYARENGVVLKGDIPIGISRNSVEAWTGSPTITPSPVKPVPHPMTSL